MSSVLKNLREEKQINTSEKYTTPHKVEHHDVIFQNGKVNFEFTNKIINQLLKLDFCEVYNMNDIYTLLTSNAFRLRNRSKRDIEEESNDRLKHDMIKTDTFGHLRESLVNIGNDGVQRYKLERSKHVPNYGRLYDRKYRLMCYMNEGVRSIGLMGNVEIDQKSCHPTTFARLYTETFGKAPITASRLVDHKESFIREMMGYYNLEDTSFNRWSVKSILLSITYGGGIGSIFEVKGSSKVRRKIKKKFKDIKHKFKDARGEYKYSPSLQGYKNEVKQMLNVITDIYPGVFKSVKNEDNNNHQNKTRTLSYVLQEVETCVSAIAVLYLIDNKTLLPREDNTYQMSFLHDGFYVKQNDKINEQLLKNISDHILQVAGVVTKFGFKAVNSNLSDDEINALDEGRKTHMMSVKEIIDKMWTMACKVFTKFPQGTTPHETLNVNNILTTNNGFDIAITQESIGCARVDIRTGGKTFISDFVYEVDTIENDRENREKMCEEVAIEVFGEAAVINNMVDIQISHNMSDYVKVREWNDMTKQWADMDFTRLRNGRQKVTMLIKACMGSGKTHIVTNEITSLILANGGSTLYVSPNKSLVNSMTVDCHRSGVEMTPYSGKKRKLVEVNQQPKGILKYAVKRPKGNVTQQTYTRSGDERVQLPPMYRDDRRLITTFDSVMKVPEDIKYDLVYIDETSQTLAQHTSSTMDHGSNRRMENMNRFNDSVENAKSVIFTDADLTRHEVQYFENKREHTLTIRTYYASSKHRLDYRRVPSIKQINGNILQSVFVNMHNIVVACSTKKGPSNVGKLIEDYVFGKMDLFFNTIDRTCQDVIDELVTIHRFSCENAVDFILTVLNGRNYISGDETPEMRKNKDLLLQQSLATEHYIHEEWLYIEGKGFLTSKLNIPTLEKTVVLAFSPSITVGVSFQTKHFQTSFGMFDNVTAPVESILQMLRRFRVLFVTRAYEGIASFNEGSFKKRMENALHTTKEYSTGVDIELMQDNLKKLYEHRYQKMNGQAKNLPIAMENVIYKSNPFNVIRREPYINTGGGRSDIQLHDMSNASIEAIINAKVLTCIQELSNGLPEEKSKFNMVTRLFPTENEDVFDPPQYLRGGSEEGKDAMRFYLENYSQFKFMRALYKGEISVSNKVIDNFTDQVKVDIKECLLLLKSLGFNSFQHYVHWCSYSKKGMPSSTDKQLLTLNEYMPDLVDRVVKRRGIEIKDQKDVIQTLRCLNIILDSRCGSLKKKNTDTRERTIHGCRTERVIQPDQTFVEFLNKFTKGDKPVVPKQESKINKHKNDKVTAKKLEDVVFKSEFGSILKYNNFQ